MEAKETNYKSILKSNIVTFISYSILIGFLFLLVVIFLKNTLSSISTPLLSILLSLISGILIYYILHFICKSSTLESTKNQSMNEENTSNFLKRMNLFFLICIIFSILICIGYLFMDKFAFLQSMSQIKENYGFISDELSIKLTNHFYEKYQNSIINKIYSTIIIEFSLVISFLSLIPYQKKLLVNSNKKN